LQRTEIKQIDDLEAEIDAELAKLRTLNTAAVRALRRKFSQRLAGARAELVFQLGLRLSQRGDHLRRFVGYELIQHHREALRSLNSKRLEQLGRGIDSWAAVDMFACYLAGPAWREHQVPDGLIAEWARSKDKWRRRAAVVSTVPLNNKARGGSGDARRSLAICKLLMNDRDDMVVKGLSWALRELAKRNPGAVVQFVSSAKEFLAPRVIREVNNKLTTGLKNPKR